MTNLKNVSAGKHENKAHDLCTSHGNVKFGVGIHVNCAKGWSYHCKGLLPWGLTHIV